MADIQVRNAADAHRYEAVVDGTVAGFAAYQLTDELVVFTHTEVDDAYEGQGIGSALVKGALDDVRAAGDRKVLPLCPFVKAYIGRHPEHRDLVYSRASRVRD